MREQEIYDLHCKGEFSTINTKLDTIDTAIRGNGKPGIIVRLDRLERSLSLWRKLTWMFAGAALTATAGLFVRLVVK